MRLLGITLSDWLSYADLDLDLSEVAQLAIAGHIGSGKSALLDAVLWSITGRGRSRGNIDSYIREGQTACSVITTWLAGEQEIRVQRTRDCTGRGQSALTLLIDGVNRTRASIVETQAAIEAIMGFTPEAILAGPVMFQEHSAEFLKMEAPDRKTVLFRLRGLDQYQPLFDRAHAIQLQAEADVTAAAARSTDAMAIIDTELSVHAQRHQVVADAEALSGEIADLQDQLDALRGRGEELREGARRRAECVRLRDAAQTRLDDSRRDLDALVADGQTYRHDLEALIPEAGDLARVSELEAARAQARTAKVQVAVIDQVPCGGVGEYAACRFLVDAISSRENLPALEARVDSLGGWDLDATALRTQIVATENERTRLGERKRRAGEWLDREPALKAQLEERVRTAGQQVADSTAEIVRLDLDLSDATEVVTALTGLTASIAERSEKLRELDRQVGQLDGQLAAIASAKELLGTYESQVATFTTRATTFKTLARAFHRDGIPTLVLENWLPEIEDRTNEILARLGPYRLHLVTQKETKVGSVRETLDVVLTVHDVERAYEMFSGGERFGIDFALRIALSEAISTSRGTRWDTLWIDEGFGSQETDSINALLAAIASVSKDFGLIVVTSHLEEVTDRFPVRLIVSKAPDDTSSVEWRT